MFGTVVDAAAGKIYWMRPGGPIFGANLDGTDVQIIPTPGAPILNPFGLALDPTTGTLYWANMGDVARAYDPSIAYAKTDGSGGGTLYSNRNLDAKFVEAPVQVAVDPPRGLIYWANGHGAGTREAGPIVYAKLDGSGSPCTII
ncbi:MAG: hypothetical protein ACR2J9_03170, partial [Gaiellales bacterium]